LHTEQSQLSFGGVESPTQFMWNHCSHSSLIVPYFSVRFRHQAIIAEHFDFQVGKVVMSETALLKSRKWKKLSFGETFE